MPGRKIVLSCSKCGHQIALTGDEFKAKIDKRLSNISKITKEALINILKNFHCSKCNAKSFVVTTEVANKAPDPLATLKSNLEKFGIGCLYHITQLANLPGILKDGLLCNAEMKRRSIKYQDISNLEIQEHRHHKRIPLNRKLTLHDCVPLFFAPKPPMLSALRDQQLEIIYLHFDPKIFVLPSVYYTDGNARSEATHFFNRIDDLAKLNWDILRASYWNNSDPTKNKENKRLRSAEVLVAKSIGSSHIMKISTMNQKAKLQVAKFLREAGRSIPVVIDSRMYFPLASPLQVLSMDDIS
jgi:hypothetical protein